MRFIYLQEFMIIKNLILAACCVALMTACVQQDDFNELVRPTVTEDNSLPRFTLSDGTILHLETFGDPDSTMLLVLHGGPGGDYEGLSVLQTLSNHYFVVLFDQRGSGLSQRLPIEELTPPKFIEDIDEIVNTYSNNKPIYLLGHSWGGALATYYVQQHPEKVAKLLLAEPGACYGAAAEVANTTAFIFSSYGLHEMLNSGSYLSFDNDNIADYRMSVFVNSDVGDYRDFASPEELQELSFTRFGFFAGYAVNDWQGNFDGTYDYDFTSGIKENYFGETLILASDKSQRLGYDFQLQYHVPKFNNCAITKIENEGHFFIELNPELALPLIDAFFLN